MSKVNRFTIGILILFAVPVLAQRITATIRGTVSDPSGAMVTGAKVTALNEENGLTRSTTTNAVGMYAFAELPVGSYQITVEQPGFKTAVRTKIIMNVGDTRIVDVQLISGDVIETISVEANALEVKTQGADLSGLVTGEQARELPLNGRNFFQLTLLMPGVTLQEGKNTVDKGLGGGADVSVSGGSTTSNLWMVDGANNNDVGSNRTILVYPSVDAIEEFKIQRNSYGAEFGQSAGAQVNLITRSGTNDLHGSAYYYARRDSLQAKNYFLKRANQDKQKLDWSDVGATLGGPLIKNKLHFFISGEVNKDKRQDVRAAFVPTERQRKGDFSQSDVGEADYVANRTQGLPIDPLTGQRFPGDVIPSNRISQAGLLFLQQYSLPNQPVDQSGNNWQQAIDTPIDWNQLHARLDYTANDSTRMMVRYTQDSWKGKNLNQGMWGDDPYPVIGSDWAQPGRSLVAQLNKNIGSQMVNSLTFSYSANKIDVTRTGENPALADQLCDAFPTCCSASGKMQGGAATPLTWGIGPYGNLWNQAPWTNNQDLFVLKDDFSAVFGKHFVKVGVLASTNKKNEQVQNTSQGEGVNLGGVSGYLNNGVLVSSSDPTGNALGNVLLNSIAWGTSEGKLNKDMQGRWQDVEFYVADSWKISPRVTLDLGVRASHLPMPWLADEAMANFDPSTINPSISSPCNGLVYPPGKNPCSALGLQGGTEGSNRALTDEKALVFSPRLGFAWDIQGDGRTAIRAGVGRFYTRERVTLAYTLGTNAPWTPNTSQVRLLDSAVDVRGARAPDYGGAGNGRELTAEIPNNWQWNVSVQRELFRNTTLEVSYVGSRGRNLTGQYDANQVEPAKRLRYAQTADNSLRPYGSIRGGQIIIWTHDRKSDYKALQTQIVSRFGNGSQFQASYTLSRMKGNEPGNNSSGGQNADIMLSDNTNPDLDYGRSLIDRTHMFNASLVLNLPKFEDKSPALKAVLGNWQLTSIIMAGSGVPLTIYSGGVPGLPGSNASQSGTGDVENRNSRPNRASGVSCKNPAWDPGNGNVQWLNPAAFTLNGFQLGQIGTSGRGECESPSYFQTDAAIYKTIPIGGKAKLQLRIEVFNLFNRDNFRGDSIGTGYSVNSPVTFNSGVGAAAASTATSITSATAAGGFGNAGNVRDPRLVQLGVRLSF